MSTTMNGGQAPTLEEVAALAGVSRSTVSRVVNGSPHVTATATESVNAAIATLGYVPNRAARNLVMGRTLAIALVFPESTARVFADPFFAAVTQGVALHLAESEYTLNIVVESESNPEKTRRYLTAGNVDGAIVVSHHTGDHSYARLGGLPVVFGGRPLGGADEPSYFVDSDNIGGAAAAIAHLISLGRRRIALIDGPQDMTAGFDRRITAERAIVDGGAELVVSARGDFTPASGTRAAQELVDSGVPFDALFAANDQMATCALAVLQAAGRRVPQDVAVIGFDDDFYARTSTPLLTTMRQDPCAMGARMAAVMLDLVEGREVPYATMFPVELVVRASSSV